MYNNIVSVIFVFRLKKMNRFVSAVVASLVYPPSCRLYSWLISHVSRGSLIYILYTCTVNIPTCTAHALDIVLTLTKLKNDAHTYIFGILHPAGCKCIFYIYIHTRLKVFRRYDTRTHRRGKNVQKTKREKRKKKMHVSQVAAG